MPLVSLADSCSHIPPFLIMDILTKAQEMQRQGIDIIHLEIGEPDFDTPACIVEQAKKALDLGYTHYTPSQGLLALQEAVAWHYKQQYDVDIDSNQVFVFPGTSVAMHLIMNALLCHEDEVIISNPCYPCYANFVCYGGGKIREVKTYEEDGFRLRPEDVAKALNAKTKAILINSPTNPTGIVMEEERIRAIVDVVDEFAIKNNGIKPLIISDEIYHGLSYTAKDNSILQFTKDALVFNGFSKAFAMTGWRLGYAIVPKQYVKGLIALMQNFILSTNAMTQFAGAYALKEAQEHVLRMKEVYNERRIYVLSALRELGFQIAVEPEGAFYVMINARHLAKKFDNSQTSSSVALAFDILEKAHIGLTPGSEFGSQAEGFLRISYANSMENLKEAMRRLAIYIQENHNTSV